jgi:hypothetical protein
MGHKARLKGSRRRLREQEREQEHIEWIAEVEARLATDREWFESKSQELSSPEVTLLREWISSMLTVPDEPRFDTSAYSIPFILAYLIEVVTDMDSYDVVDRDGNPINEEPLDYKSETIEKLVQFTSEHIVLRLNIGE